MPTFSQLSPRKKYAVLGGVVLLLLTIIYVICCWLMQTGAGEWIELFNGATWPDGLKKGPKGRGFLAVLTIRTFLNLGAVLSILSALFWFLAGGLERMIMKQVETLQRMRTSALVGEMLRVLEEAELLPPPDVEQRMYEAARAFDETAAGAGIKRAQAEATE